MILSKVTFIIPSFSNKYPYKPALHWLKPLYDPIKGQMTWICRSFTKEKISVPIY